LAEGEGKAFLESLLKITRKAREFFIPDILTIVLSMVVNWEAQLLTRSRDCKGIMIGHSWWHGGMQFFAERHGYKTPGRFYCSGDSTAYDTSVLDFFLNLYSQSVAVFYDIKDPFSKRFFKAILDEVTTRLSIKITQLIGNIWRIIVGGMPSGDYVTSNGDSWIICFCFFFYYVYQATVDPDFRKQMHSLFKLCELVMSLYGDDDVNSGPDSVKKYFSEEKIVPFFKDFFGITLRDWLILTKFLSTPDGLGGLSEKCVVFLQKYAIKTPPEFQGPGMPEVVHFRPLMTNVRKFAKGSGDEKTDLDYFLAAITGPYDNPCNEQWYDFCRLAYSFFGSRVGSWQERIDHVLQNKDASRESSK